MYSESAALYDLIYTPIKDYSAEAGQVAGLLRRARPRSRTLPDGACGPPEPARVRGPAGAHTVEAGDLRVTRIHRSERDGERCRLYFEYTIEGPDGTRESTEVHELGLFTVDEMLAAFSAAGLAVTYDPNSPIGRGVY